jgi:UDP-2-acetamido-3-amino-2,3-dideoxy-glucuronate N-acetyltransferase
MAVRIADSADVAASAALGDGTTVWHLAQVREGAVLGMGCILGRGACVGTGVRMGDNCKLQNDARVYEPALLGDGVFVGPAVVFTNDHYPRAVDPDGRLERGDDCEPVGVTCREGSSIGARSVCIAPLTLGAVGPRRGRLGRHPGRARLRARGGGPACRVRWVGRAGVPLEPGKNPDAWVCPRTGQAYVHHDNTLTEAQQ